MKYSRGYPFSCTALFFPSRQRALSPRSRLEAGPLSLQDLVDTVQSFFYMPFHKKEASVFNLATYVVPHLNTEPPSLATPHAIHYSQTHVLGERRQERRSPNRLRECGSVDTVTAVERLPWGTRDPSSGPMDRLRSVEERRRVEGQVETHRATRRDEVFRAR